MILKASRTGQGTMRVNASHQAACRTSHAGRDARVPCGQRHSQLRRSWPQSKFTSWSNASCVPSSTWVCQEKTKDGFVKKRQRNRAPLSRQDQRTQLGADQPLDRLDALRTEILTPQPALFRPDRVQAHSWIGKCSRSGGFVFWGPGY